MAHHSYGHNICESESYRTVSPALFETALKVKYASDSDTTEMYDIIRSSCVFDFGRIFNDNMSAYTYNMFRGCLTSGSKNWISTYEGKESAMKGALEKIITELSAK